MKPRMSVARCCCGAAPPSVYSTFEVRTYTYIEGVSAPAFDDNIILMPKFPFSSMFANTHTWHHYLNVAIPNGATIVSAKIVSMVNDAAGTNRTVEISLANTDNVLGIGTAVPPYPHTVATLWNATAADVETTDFSASLQQVINRPGWSSGNAIGIHFESGGGVVLPHPYDRLSWNSTQLEVAYV